MSLDVRRISVQEISLILGHALHYRMEPSLFATILPYMNTVLSNALSKAYFYHLIGKFCFQSNSMISRYDLILIEYCRSQSLILDVMHILTCPCSWISLCQNAVILSGCQPQLY